MQHISDMHSKSAIRPHTHHVWKYGRHPTAEIRRGKERRYKSQGKNIMVCPIP